MDYFNKMYIASIVSNVITFVIWFEWSCPCAHVLHNGTHIKMIYCDYHSLWSDPYDVLFWWLKVCPLPLNCPFSGLLDRCLARQRCSPLVVALIRLHRHGPERLVLVILCIYMFPVATPVKGDRCAWRQFGDHRTPVQVLYCKHY